MRLAGVLRDRGAWSTSGHCPIEKAMGLVGSRNAMLTMREAFYGTTRYDDFAERVGMSPATTAANLKALVAAGLLERRPYRDEGTRTRDGYVLSAAGQDLMPVVFGLFEWGKRHTQAARSLDLTHADCGERVHVEMVCDAGHRPAPDDVELHYTG